MNKHWASVSNGMINYAHLNCAKCHALLKAK